MNGELPVYTETDDTSGLPLGTKYIRKNGCPQCRGDLEVGQGVYVHCTRIVLAKGGDVAKDSPCDYRLLAG